MPSTTASNPIPNKDSLADNENAIRIHSDRLDDWGRGQFTAFWIDDHLPPNGVRGQVFNTNVADFIARTEANGRKVTALDDHTQTILDALR